MIAIRHLPRPTGVLPLGRDYWRLTMAVMAHAARVQQREREKAREADAERVVEEVREMWASQARRRA